MQDTEKGRKKSKSESGSSLETEMNEVCVCACVLLGTELRALCMLEKKGK